MTGRQLMDPVCWPSRLLSMALKRCGSRSAQPRWHSSPAPRDPCPAPQTPTPGANPPLVAPGPPRDSAAVGPRTWPEHPVLGCSNPEHPMGKPHGEVPPTRSLSISPSPPSPAPHYPFPGGHVQRFCIFPPKIEVCSQGGKQVLPQGPPGLGGWRGGLGAGSCGCRENSDSVLKALPFFNIFFLKPNIG